MSLVSKFIGFGFRQVIGAVAGEETGEIAAKVAGSCHPTRRAALLRPQPNLAQSPSRANDRAWQALGIALAGDGFLDKIKVFFASADDKGIREQVALLAGQEPSASRDVG